MAVSLFARYNRIDDKRIIFFSRLTPEFHYDYTKKDNGRNDDVRSLIYLKTV